MDVDAEAELGCALVLHHPDAPAAARIASQPRSNPADTILSRNGSELLPRCGALLMLGDVDAASDLLQQPGTYWLPARLLGPQRLAAAVPPLARWSEPGLAAKFADRLVAMAGDGDDERRGALARIGAVLAARLLAGGDEAAAAQLRARLRVATAGLIWRAGDWLGD